jgi:hypothetical protein
MGDAGAQVHEGGRQPVGEHQPVQGAGSNCPPARPVGQACVPARLPARSQFGDQLSQNLRGQPGHSAIGDRSGTSQRPGHTTTLLRPSRASRPR